MDELSTFHGIYPLSSPSRNNWSAGHHLKKKLGISHQGRVTSWDDPGSPPEDRRLGLARCCADRIRFWSPRGVRSGGERRRHIKCQGRLLLPPRLASSPGFQRGRGGRNTGHRGRPEFPPIPFTAKPLPRRIHPSA